MKYNWSIIGHQKQMAMLESDIANENIAHAYLMVGPNSVGKYTVAKKFAGILQCSNDFCHDCQTCLQVDKGSHVDTFEMRDEGGSIKIAEVRSVIDRISMTRQSRYKVVIIQSIERMTIPAANSFLKMLEEPPERTVFILTSNNVRLILPTILSRVRMLKFHGFSDHFLINELHKQFPDADEKTVKHASLFALGKAGKALNLVSHPEKLAEYMEIYHHVEEFLAGGEIADRFSYIEDLSSQEGNKVELFLNILMHVARSRLLELGRDCQRYINLLSKIQEAGILLDKNVNSRLVLENLMLAI